MIESTTTLKSRMNYTHIIYTAITIIFILSLLNAIDYAIFYGKFMPLPNFLKSFLLRYSPMFGVALSFFLWNKDIARPSRLYIALFLIFIFRIAVFGNFFSGLAEAILNHGEPFIIGDGVIPKNYVIYSYAYYVLIFMNKIAQVVLAWMILKRSDGVSKVIKAVLICFIVYVILRIFHAIYFEFIYLRFMPSSVRTIQDEVLSRKWQRITNIVSIPLNLSRIAVLIPIFPMIVQYRGKQSLWRWFINGPFRKFKKIMSPYNKTDIT